MSQGWLWFEKEKVGEEKTKTWVSSVRSQPKSKTRDYFKLWYIQILCTSSQISRVNVNKNRRPTKKNRTHNLHRMSGRWEGCIDVNTKLERGLMIIVL